MSDSEAIEAARRGVRVAGEFSLHETDKPGLCPGFNHRWRTIACDGIRDVVECRVCGRQEVCGCDFDEEFA